MPKSVRLIGLRLGPGCATPLTRIHRTNRPRLRIASLPGHVGRFALDADLTDDHVDALVLWFCLGSAASLAFFALAGAGPAGALALGVCGVPAILARRLAGRRIQRLVAALPELVDTIARSLRSGASLAQAIDETVADSPQTIGRELAGVAGAVRRGQPADHALRQWVERVPRPEVRIVAAALALASRNEAGSTQALDGVSHSLRDRAALHAEIRAHSAQAAASMQALVLLPLLFLGLDAFGSQTTLRFLTTETLGQMCLGGALFLDIVGWFWMSTIIRRRLPR